MERDFMGLALKRETPDEPIDAAPVRSLPMQWSYSNKASALPQLLSFHGSQEDRPKTGFDSLASTGLVTITTAEKFDSDRVSFQKNIVPEKQGGVRYTIHHPVTGQANRTVLPAMSTAVQQPFVGSVSPSPQHLPGVSITNTVSPMHASNNIVVGTTNLRNGSKVSGGPTQLTIFYNGSVCVYDNISPEKAQAIMLLAGNGPPTTPTTTPPATPVQVPAPKSSVLDGFVMSQPYGTVVHRPSPSPITSISISQRAAQPNDATVGKPGGMFTSCYKTEPVKVLSSNHDITVGKPGSVLVSSYKAEPLNIINSQAPVSDNFLSSSTVPQFRRKSLARFLEKRKERVINTSPYANKQSPDSSNPGAGSSTSLSVNSSSSCAVPATN